MNAVEAQYLRENAQVMVTAGADYASGEVLLLSDGRVGVVAGSGSGFKSGEPATLNVQGHFALKSASATTFALGDAVHWDVSANLAIAAASAEPGDPYCGLAIKAKTSGQLVVHVDLNCRPKKKQVVAHTADFTLTAQDSGTVHTTVGAGGTVVASLPAATVGLEYFFRVGAAQELRIDPNGTEVISLPSTGVPGAAGKYLTANADGESVHLLCTKAGEWNVMGYTGTWTAEG